MRTTAHRSVAVLAIAVAVVVSSAGVAAAADATSTTVPTTDTTAAGTTTGPTTAEELAQLVVKAKKGCKDFKPSSGLIGGAGAPVGDTGHCTISDDIATLVVYTSPDDLKTALAAKPRPGCDAARSSGKKVVLLVVGPNWTLQAPSETTTKSLAKALKGKSKSLKCT